MLQKNFDILAINSNYFDSSTKLFIC